MKRDMDLIRNMLLLVEDADHGFAPKDMRLDGYTEEQIGYHAYLLVDSGLAEGADVTHMGSSGPQYILTRLTWAGHDFADACRDQTVWEKAKTTVKGTVSSVTFDVMKELLTSFLKAEVGLT